MVRATRDVQGASDHSGYRPGELGKLLELSERDLLRCFGQLEVTSKFGRSEALASWVEQAEAEAIGRSRLRAVYRLVRSAKQEQDLESLIQGNRRYDALAQVVFRTLLWHGWGATSALVAGALAVKFSDPGHWAVRTRRENREPQPPDISFLISLDDMLGFSSRLLAEFQNADQEPMLIDLAIHRKDRGFYVTAEDIVGLRMWHRDRERIAERLPARAKWLLKSNHGIVAEVAIHAPEGVAPAEALGRPHPRLVVTREDG
jgi:hypothetical protein